MENDREIAIAKFYGEDWHIYKDQMGFSAEYRKEARSNIMHDIFMYYLELVHLQLVFYYTDDDTFYAISTLDSPIEVKILPRDRNRSRYIGFQCECDADDDGEVLGLYNTVQEIWDNCIINGKTLQKVLSNSFICALN